MAREFITLIPHYARYSSGSDPGFPRHFVSPPAALIIWRRARNPLGSSHSVLYV